MLTFKIAAALLTVLNLSRDVGYAILKLNQGHALGSWDEVTVIVRVAINVKQHNGSVCTCSKCSGGGALSLQQTLLTNYTGYVSAVRADGNVTCRRKVAGDILRNNHSSQHRTPKADRTGLRQPIQRRAYRKGQTEPGVVVEAL